MLAINKVHTGLRVVGCLCALFLVFSCAQLELEEAPASSGGADSEAETNGGGGSGSASIDLSSAISVAEAQRAENLGEEVVVCGYYLGFVEGTVLSDENLLLVNNTTKPNTNILLGDSPFDCFAEDLFPVELRTTGGVRDSLNLYDHPELFKKRIAIRGTLNTYFRVNGLKNVLSWWVMEEDNDDDNDDDNDNDDQGGGENESTDTTGGGTGEEVERIAFPVFVENRSAARAN